MPHDILVIIYYNKLTTLLLIGAYKSDNVPPSK